VVINVKSLILWRNFVLTLFKRNFDINNRSGHRPHEIANYFKSFTETKIRQSSQINHRL